MGQFSLACTIMPFDSPRLTFVHAGVARYAAQLAAQGVKLCYQRTAEHEFHSIGLKDPAGQMLVVLEARTYSPVLRGPERTPLCGYFEEFSMPSTDFARAKRSGSLAASLRPRKRTCRTCICRSRVITLDIALS